MDKRALRTHRVRRVAKRDLRAADVYRAVCKAGPVSCYNQ